MKFSELGLMPLITKSLGSMGYEAPTPIQTQAIPPALAGRDVLGCAQTGTGKTCAFATPILQRLASSQKKGERPIRALILTPTRELALQIQENFEAYGQGLPLRSAVIFGGVGQQPQVEKIKKGLDILVATPGRLLDLHGQGLLDLSKIEIFVLDEADRMLDMGFIHDVRRVLKLLPQQKQTLFFSATMPPEVMELVDALLHDPVRVAVDPISSPVEVIEQSVYFVDKGNKTKLLGHLIKENAITRALVFTRTKHGANRVAQELGRQGLTAAAIHGNKSQTARQKALADFKAGKVRVLVATDIAARGIDIEELPYVFNYDLPEVPETYVHRIGRTGRAGHEGIAIAFCEFGEQDYLKGIEKLIGRKLPVKESQWPMQVLEAAPKDKRTRVSKVVKPTSPKTNKQQQGAPEAEQAPAQEKKPAQAKRPKQQPAKQETQAQPETQAKQPAKTEKPKGRPMPKPVPQSQPMKQTKPVEPSKTEPAVEKTRKKKFAAPTKTLAEFEAEEQAFQERIAKERKQRNAVSRAGALAGEIIMDATARLLAPKKTLQSMQQPACVKQEKAAPQKQGRSAEKMPKQPAKQEQKPKQPVVGKGKKREEPVKKQPATPQRPQETKGSAPKTGKSAKQEGMRKLEGRPAAQSAPTEEKKARRRRDVPRPVEMRASRIKDSTEQPSLMKPFYFGPED